MGNLCSSPKSTDAVEQSTAVEASTAASAGVSSSRRITNASEATTIVHDNTHNRKGSAQQSLKVVEIQQSVNGNTRMASVDLNDNSSSLIYYDAVDSFSNAIFNMSYPPTGSMLHPTKSSGKRISLLDPTTMLSRRSLDVMAEEEEKSSKPHPRASVIKVTRVLESESLGIPGYPGELNDKELQACLDFREKLKTRKPAFNEVVHHGSPIEDEAFALCRFLRARAFNVEETFEMMEKNNVPELWNDAKAHDFYKDLEKQFDCPAAVLMTQIPLVISGIGRNGASVIYLGAGSGINVDGVECITDMADLVPFVWYFLYEEGKRSLEREAKLHDPSEVTILAERIVIMDLAGVPGALFSSRGMDFIKEACKVPGCFPEIINRMYMLNAPFSFSIAWNVIKLFVEPRTVQKTGFFSNKDKAAQDLLSYIDSTELLSDYGGSGPSFADVQLERQQEVSSHDRYIVEMMSVNKRESKFHFSIDKNETIVSIVVYTKADHGATFTILAGKETLVDQQEVSRQTGSDKIHFNKNLGPINYRDGTKDFVVKARGTGKENYLVAVTIDKI